MIIADDIAHDVSINIIIKSLLHADIDSRRRIGNDGRFGGGGGGSGSGGGGDGENIAESKPAIVKAPGETIIELINVLLTATTTTGA